MGWVINHGCFISRHKVVIFRQRGIKNEIVQHSPIMGLRKAFMLPRPRAGLLQVYRFGIIPSIWTIFISIFRNSPIEILYYPMDHINIPLRLILVRGMRLFPCRNFSKTEKQDKNMTYSQGYSGISHVCNISSKIMKNFQFICLISD